MKVWLCLSAAILCIDIGMQANAADFYHKSGSLGSLRGNDRPNCKLNPNLETDGRPPCAPPKPAPDLSAKERVHILITRAEYLFLAQHELALAELKEALEVDPSNAEAWHFSARYKLTLGDMTGAWADLETALKLDPSDANIWATRGSIQHNSSDGLRDLDKALSLDPKNAFALIHRIYRNQGINDKKALEADLAALAAIQPDHPIVTQRKLEESVKAGDYAAAIDQLNSRLAKEPASFSLLLERAVLLQALGDHEGAVRDYSTILGSGEERLRYAIGPQQAAGLYFARAVSLNELKRGIEAHSDVMRALQTADIKLLLRMQIFLNSKGYKDVEVTGKMSPQLLEAATSCMANPACGKGLTSKI